MDGSDLRQRVTVQTSTEADDGHRGLTVTWSDLRRRIAARIVPLSGRDLERARQIDARASHEVTLRWWQAYSTDLDAGRARLTWHDGIVGDRVLEIVEVPRETEHRARLDMICREAA